jgi:uncharacterized protein (DUF4415 family)/uncharacterized DUF497 family protein
MEIEFDPHKEATNLKKHEISLKRAADLVVSDYELVVRKGEVRVQAIGVIDGEHFSLAFVFRRNVVRAISLRRAHQEEIDRMSRKNKGLAEEGAAFNRGTPYDGDNPEWTEERLARARPASELPTEILAFFPKTLVKVRGAQKAPTKIPVSLRLSREVVDHYKATGEGWQTRIDDALRDLIKKAG